MKYTLAEETLGYVTSTDPSNTDRRFLVAPSKNVLIDYQRKIIKRSGYTRLGASNSALTPIRNAWTWNTSTTIDLPQRQYDDELEVYLTTVDTQEVNAWVRVKDGWSTTEKMRVATVWDSGEKIDLQISVIGDANLYEWGGGIAAVSSVTGTTITKKGTTTFAQNRFYTTRNKTLVCVRTGTEYTYTGGETTTTLTGIADTAGLVEGDILVQKVVTESNKPASSHTNHFIHEFENQIVVGSEDDQEVWLSKSTNYRDFSYSSPRVTGEGARLTISKPTRALTTVGEKLLIFSGNSSLFKVEFSEIEVGGVIAETVKVKKLDTGVNQGALNQESVVSIGSALAYLTCEVALRIIEDPDELVGINPKTFSTPIKPDFDAETWTNAFGFWYKNMLIFTAPTNQRMYMLNFLQDADGNLVRFWNPPQTFPIGPLSLINSGNGDLLHGHSSSIAESYLLFDGQSDNQYEGMDMADKFAIDAVAAFPYDNFGERAKLKTFDEYYVEGEITPNTTGLNLDIRYDFDGSTQTLNKIISGADNDILQGSVGINSLAQQSLATNPLGSLLNPPSNARKFAVVFEIAREDFLRMSPIFSDSGIDTYWAIIAHGSNASLSPRRTTLIRK